jgi:sulfate adenylyltransferase subunit 2
VNRLDALEAQSIFIFREAFARLKHVALLWSLGKDSNVMIWIARKAFFGRVPFPVLHVDTGKKFPEMYAFRNRYAAEWISISRSSCAHRSMLSIRHCRQPPVRRHARPKD